MRNPPPPIVIREDSRPRRPSSGWLGVPIALALLAGAWVAMMSTMQMDPFAVRQQSVTILESFGALVRDPTFPGVLGSTLLTAGLGFLIALFLAGVVASVFAGNLRMGTLVLLGVPAAALMPWTFLLLGTGTGTAIAATALLAFGPMGVGFAADGAARRPAAEVGVAMALNGTVMVEPIADLRGLGALAYRSALLVFDLPTAAAALLVLAAVGIVAVLAVHVLFGVFVRDDRAP